MTRLIIIESVEETTNVDQVERVMELTKTLESVRSDLRWWLDRGDPGEEDEVQEIIEEINAVIGVEEE